MSQGWPVGRLESQALLGRRLLFLAGDFSAPLLDGQQTSLLGWMEATRAAGAHCRFFSPLAGARRRQQAWVAGMAGVHAAAAGAPVRCLGALLTELRHFRPELTVVRTLAAPAARHRWFYRGVFALVRATGCRLVVAPWGGSDHGGPGSWLRGHSVWAPIAVPAAGAPSPGVVLATAPKRSVGRDIGLLFLNGTRVFSRSVPDYLLNDRGLAIGLEALQQASAATRLTVAVPALIQGEGRQWWAAEVARRGLAQRTTTLGAVTEVGELFARTQAYLLPHRIADTFWYPHSVVEAMYYGATPVMYDSGVARILTGGGQGGLLLDTALDRRVNGARIAGFLAATDNDACRRQGQVWVESKFCSPAARARAAGFFVQVLAAEAEQAW